MKKAKMMISAIAVFAVLGGALALKANTKGHTVYTGPDALDCTFTTSLTTTDNINAPVTFITDVYGDPACAQQKVVDLP